jgi:pyridoxamine 5'-phosphate oxidase
MDPSPDLSSMRVRYVPGPLHAHEVLPDPLAQVRRWLAEAVAAGVPEPNAMVLATATPQGRSSARTVLVKELDERGFVFYTNLRSRKARDIAANPAVGLCFPWFPMARQVVVEGVAETLHRDTVEAYWVTRPRESQLGAWASEQSQPVASREALHAQLQQVTARFEGQAVLPVPPQWGGFRVVPDLVELWQGQPGRLHDRLRYTWAQEWTLTRIQP